MNRNKLAMLAGCGVLALGLASCGKSGKNPMSAAQLREKFFDCAAHAKVTRSNAEKIAAILDKLGDQASLSELWPLLRKT